MRLKRGNVPQAGLPTAAQLVRVNCCNLQPGDLLGSGILSGQKPNQAGSLLELTLGGKQPISLPNGERRTLVEDGMLTLYGWCEHKGAVRIAEPEENDFLLNLVDFKCHSSRWMMDG